MFYEDQEVFDMLKQIGWEPFNAQPSEGWAIYRDGEPYETPLTMVKRYRDDSLHLAVQRIPTGPGARYEVRLYRDGAVVDQAVHVASELLSLQEELHYGDWEGIQHRVPPGLAS